MLADVREAHMNFGSRFEEIPELDVTGTYEKWEAGEVSLVDVREPDEQLHAQPADVQACPPPHAPCSPCGAWLRRSPLVFHFLERTGEYGYPR